LLRNASEEARETIGEGLVDALALLGGSGTQDIEKATAAMSDLSMATADVIRGQAVVLSNLGDIGGGSVGKIGNALKIYFKEVLGIQALQDLGASTRPRPRAGRSFGGSSIQGNIYDPAAAAKAKADKAAAALAKKQLDATKKLTAEQKKQNALKKAATVFDLEQIGIIAALQGNISKEEKMRLEAQLALLNNNEQVASSLTKQILMSQDATGNLYKLWQTLPDARNPFAYLEEYLNGLAKKAATVLSGGVSGTAPVIPTNVTPAFVGTPFGQAGSSQEASAIRQLGTPFGQAGGNGSGYMGTPFGQAPIVVQIDGKAIATALQDTSMSGITSNINRTSGGFGL
jgi:hypothetical protein